MRGETRRLSAELEAATLIGERPRTPIARSLEPIGIALAKVDSSYVAGGSVGRCRWSVTRTVDGAPSLSMAPSIETDLL
jgi:hypothetical protein